LGFPQGTMLVFLFYINNIAANIKSSIQLFTNDCIIYRIIDSKEDIKTLQDLNKNFLLSKNLANEA